MTKYIKNDVGYNDRWQVIDPWVERCAQGNSFVDIGGLWSIGGERVSTASRAGASSLALWDMYAPGAVEWKQLRSHLDSKGVGDCQFISGDFMKSDGSSQYDVVLCCGVIYHIPDVVGFLSRLRRITKKRLIIGGITLPRTIASPQGNIEMPSSGALFVPGLSSEQKNILGTVWNHPGGVFYSAPCKAESEYPWETYSGWWWLLSYDCFSKMLKSVGFEIIEVWTSHSYMAVYCK